jgi:hypothetical protein
LHRDEHLLANGVEEAQCNATSPCCAQLQNPHLGPKLRGMSLTPENAFGCLMEFVFPPKPEMYRRVTWTESGEAL